MTEPTLCDGAVRLLLAQVILLVFGGPVLLAILSTRRAARRALRGRLGRLESH